MQKRFKAELAFVRSPSPMDSVLEAYAESEPDSEPEPELQRSKRTKLVVHELDELQDNDSDDEVQSRKKSAPNEDWDFQLVAVLSVKEAHH